MTLKKYILQKLSEDLCSQRNEHFKKSKLAINRLRDNADPGTQVFIIIYIMQSDWLTKVL